MRIIPPIQGRVSPRRQIWYKSKEGMIQESVKNDENDASSRHIIITSSTFMTMGFIVIVIFSFELITSFITRH